MLREILNRLADGRTWSIEALAQDLGTTPELVTAAIEDLARRGYLTPVDPACSGTCTSCSTASGCTSRSSTPHVGQRDHRVFVKSS